MHRILLLK